jgi:hypothetical protein
MDLNSYQHQALDTDQVPASADPGAAAAALIVPLCWCGRPPAASGVPE